MNSNAKSNPVLAAIAIVFLLLAVAFVRDARRPAAPSQITQTGTNLVAYLANPVHDLGPVIPLVDRKFIDPAPSRVSIAEALRKGADPSDYDCYLCHERNKPLKIKFDVDSNIILPKEHSDLVMGHGRHKRNNNCFNCHDETNLELLQTRDGRQLKLADSTPLCGSCHGPTYRDWEAGVHGRTSGFWDRKQGDIARLGCTSCHNPHAPPFPTRQPAPAPHALHPLAEHASSQ
jgi:formate-dependent nitrite reductase cytochrome c552 subunit